jgi:hypothetical protein
MKWTGKVAPAVKYLLCTLKALSLNPCATKKLKRNKDRDDHSGSNKYTQVYVASKKPT